MPVAPETPLPFIAQKLDAIEAALHQLGWWQATPPAAKDLASTLPFCVDTLSFAQWLQFILLARLRAMLAAGQPLPSAISLYPMAQQSFAGLAEDTGHLTEALAQLDEALSGQRVAR